MTEETPQYRLNREELEEQVKELEARIFANTAINEEVAERYELVMALANKRIEEANVAIDTITSFVENYLLLEHPTRDEYTRATTPKDVIAFNAIKQTLKRIVPLNDTQVSAARRK